MTITKESKHIDLLLTIIPGLFVIGIGILEINFPHIMDGLDDGYTGSSGAGFILLLFELFLMLTWGKIEGIFLILLGIILLIVCLSFTSNNKFDSKTGKAIAQTAKFVWKRRNKIPVEKMVNISDSKNSEAITQTVKAIAKAYIQETSETEEAEKTEEKSGKRSRRLGKTARSLAKKYLEQQ